MTQKKLIIPFLLVFMINATAQDALLTGNRIIGGGFAITQSDQNSEHPINYYYQDEETSISSFSFSPYYGRIYEDHTMVGIRLNIANSSIDRENGDDNSIWTSEYSTRSYGIGGFIRKYFPSTDRFGVFVQSGIDLRHSKSESLFTNVSFNDSFPDQWSSQDTWTITGSIDAEAGLYFFILSQLTIETNLARFALGYSDMEITSVLNENGERIKGEGDSVDVNFNIINHFTFDKIFTLNYYF
ncbi:hypothetical protein [Ekhidna sp.]|uniref:hypothetical protein n=1 Tax=Ekhidna sp. TaxID=2608089 RepID=UPI003CCB9A6F